MKTKSSIKNQSVSFNYPHPLIKDLSDTIHFSNQCDPVCYPPPLYSSTTFHPDIKSIPSSKLLRLSNSKVAS